MHARASANFHNRLAGVDWPNCQWIANARERIPASRRKTRKPLGIITKELCCIQWSAMKMVLGGGFDRHTPIDFRDLVPQGAGIEINWTSNRHVTFYLVQKPSSLHPRNNYTRAPARLDFGL